MKRLLFALILVLALFQLSSFPVFAQTSSDPNIVPMAEDAEGNIAKFNLDSVSTFWSAAGCTVLNTGCTVDGEVVTPTSAISSTNQIMASILTNPPVQTSTYVADVLKNIGIAQPVYAQGVGFAGLSPILTVWKAFRNLAYFIFIVVFVVIGFMIMIRKKISNNAVLTIQEALPKIIVTLLLITFSYAIAGLIIDAMYLSIFVITGLFEQAQILDDATSARNVLFSRNVLGIGWQYFMGAKDVAGTGAEAIGAIITQVFGGFLGTISNGLAYLILAVAIFIALFRTLLALITAYVHIILSVIFAPIQLLLNAFAGSDSFGKWIKGLFANAAVFPVTVVMIILGIYLGGNYNAGDAADFGFSVTPNPSSFEHAGFIPPLISSGGGRWAEAGDVNNIKAIIALGIVLLLPEVVKMVKETLQVKEPAYGEAAMKNAQAGHGWVTRPAGMILNAGVSSVGTTIGSNVVRRWEENAARRQVARQESLKKRQIGNTDNINQKLDEKRGTALPSAGSMNLGRGTDIQEGGGPTTN